MNVWIHWECLWFLVLAGCQKFASSLLQGDDSGWLCRYRICSQSSHVATVDITGAYVSQAMELWHGAPNWTAYGMTMRWWYSSYSCVPGHSYTPSTAVWIPLQLAVENQKKVWHGIDFFSPGAYRPYDAMFDAYEDLVTLWFRQFVNWCV